MLKRMKYIKHTGLIGVLLILLVVFGVAGCGRVKVEIDDGTGICPEGAEHEGSYFDDLPITINQPLRDNETEEKLSQFFEQLQTYRMENGANALRYNDEIALFADARAKEVSSVFSHTRPNEEPFWLKLLSDDEPVMAEVFARNGNSAEEVMAAFTASAPHRDILLNSSYHSVGLAVYKRDNVWYWVAAFGK